MFSEEDLDRFKKIVDQLKISTANNHQGNDNEKPDDNENNAKACPNITPSAILVIAGLLSGALEVSSVLVSKNQIVEVVLAGSLRRQTQLEKIMEQIGKRSFEEVIQAMLNGIR